MSEMCKLHHCVTRSVGPEFSCPNGLNFGLMASHIQQFHYLLTEVHQACESYSGIWHPLAHIQEQRIEDRLTHLQGNLREKHHNEIAKLVTWALNLTQKKCYLAKLRGTGKWVSER